MEESRLGRLKQAIKDEARHRLALGVEVLRRLGALEEEFGLRRGRVDGRLTELENGYATRNMLAAGLDHAREERAVLFSRAEDHEHVGYSDRLEDLEKGQGQVEDRLEDLEKGQGQVEDRLEGLEERGEGRLAAIERRLRELERRTGKQPEQPTPQCCAQDSETGWYCVLPYDHTGGHVFSSGSTGKPS